MNIDPSKAAGNGSLSSSSLCSSPKQCLANGGCGDKAYSSLSNDFSFPPEGIPSLRLPVVNCSCLTCYILFVYDADDLSSLSIYSLLVMCICALWSFELYLILPIKKGMFSFIKYMLGQKIQLTAVQVDVYNLSILLVV